MIYLRSLATSTNTRRWLTIPQNSPGSPFRKLSKVCRSGQVNWQVVTRSTLAHRGYRRDLAGLVYP